MSFSSRRRNYLLTPHRRDGLIEWMKSMLMHSFVLDALDTTAADTFSHFEMLIDEHRLMTDKLQSEMNSNSALHVSSSNLFVQSRLKQLVPSVGTFYTRLPLRKAFEAYNAKYGVTKRRHICISFNEIRHILNLAQILAMIHPTAGQVQIERIGIPPRPPPALSEGSKSEVNEQSNGQHDTSIGYETPVMFTRKELTNVLETPRATWALDDNIATPDLSPTPLREYMGRDHRSDSLAIDENLCLTTYPLPGPKLLCFDGDQTLYSDGANFDKNQKLAKYLYLLLKHGVTIAVVTAAGYEYQTMKYELRLSGLLTYFMEKGLEVDDLERFYIFGGECNYLLRVSRNNRRNAVLSLYCSSGSAFQIKLGKDYKLHAVREDGPGGWIVSTKYFAEAPGNWPQSEITRILDKAEASFQSSLSDQNMRARIIRKKRSVGLIPKEDEKLPREALDEAVLRIQTELDEAKVVLPFCAFNGGRDAWVDVGNKRVGVQVLQSYLGIPPEETLHIGDQFLNTGNDFAARSICPCVWITSPDETTYILKSILRLAGVPLMSLVHSLDEKAGGYGREDDNTGEEGKKVVDFTEMERRLSGMKMDVFTGEIIPNKSI
ncbi:hypothetical protein HJC23_007475 [Cyclotella cryptica]|uniref:IMP-specific 5'-nucleotidase 1 n=1 Tax=Cyclotella cryptica TaxID=29204 RepID=A0ABD3NTD3_9STRA|eukprot:CCRYP_019710-RA/>CCRYP_019710-RA protein AED:0.02 eAED:0.02 QI:395/1/1/1/0.5/0.2/5/67/603